MVIRFSLVTVVEQDDIANIENTVGASLEETFEISSRLRDFRKPDHGWKISLATLQKLSLQLDVGSVASNGSS